MKSPRLLFCLTMLLAGPVGAAEVALFAADVNVGSASPVMSQTRLDGFSGGSLFANHSVLRGDFSNAFVGTGLQTVADARAAFSDKYDQAVSDEMDVWLKMLFATGLVVLQLRRKQKSLPQRPVMDTANELSVNAIAHAPWRLGRQSLEPVVESGVYDR